MVTRLGHLYNEAAGDAFIRGKGETAHRLSRSPSCHDKFLKRIIFMKERTKGLSKLGTSCPGKDKPQVDM